MRMGMQMSVTPLICIPRVNYKYEFIFLQSYKFLSHVLWQLIFIYRVGIYELRIFNPPFNSKNYSICTKVRFSFFRIPIEMTVCRVITKVQKIDTTWLHAIRTYLSKGFFISRTSTYSSNAIYEYALRYDFFNRILNNSFHVYIHTRLGKFLGFPLSPGFIA